MLDSLVPLWNQATSYTWWQALLIGTLCFLIDTFLCIANWYIRKETILECGYKRSRARRIKKEIKQWPWKDKILLRRLAREATERSPMISLSLFLLYLNALCGLAAGIGYIGTIFSCGAGWAMVLQFYSGPFTLFFSTAVTFVPDLLWVPSERKRYGLKVKKK